MSAFLKAFIVAFRQLRKTPGFSITIVVTLALGIGAATTVFSLVEAILLRPLPFQQPDRLVLLGDHLGDSPGVAVTAREIATYQQATSAFSSVGAYTTSSYELSGKVQPEQVNAARFSASVFPTLGVSPALGRVFTQQEENAHQANAVICYALWLERYHRDPTVLGTSIVLDRKPYTIIGVMPRNFEFPIENGILDRTQLWVPLSLTADELSEQETGDWHYNLLARVQNGLSLSQAAQDADRVARQIMRDFPPAMSALRIRGDARSLPKQTVADARPVLRVFLFAVGVVLLIACMNSASLLLVRAIRRRREFAIRLALGAQSGVILRESMLEGLILSMLGGLLGIAIAAAALRTTLHLLPDSMPRMDSVSLNWTVAGFALLLALATGVFCSLAPAFVALHTNLKECMQEGSSTSSGASSHAWLRSVLVITEIAIAMVLLTACGAFLRSFQKMQSVDPGYRADHVLVAGYQLPLTQYATQDSAAAFNHAVVEKLAAKPGVTAAGITTTLPAIGGWAAAAYTLEGEPASSWKLKFSRFAMTDGNYFQAMGISLLDGRAFTDDDRGNAPLVIVVNQSMAKHSWPGQRAIGKRLHVGNPKKNYPWATVVGVVADTRDARDEPTSDQWYAPANQPAILNGPAFSGALAKPSEGYIALRSALPLESMTHVLRSTAAEIDPLLALQHMQRMQDIVSNTEAPRRFNTGLVTAFAAGALLLAITGIYAVVAFSVSMRTQEIAIRMALGAQRRCVAKLILMSGTKLALIGCTTGTLASLAASRLLTSFLFGVSATDPLIHAASFLIVVCLAVAASSLPAKRASGTDPIRALRAT